MIVRLFSFLRQPIVVIIVIFRQLNDYQMTTE
jgi:hypothetical protein